MSSSPFVSVKWLTGDSPKTYPAPLGDSWKPSTLSGSDQRRSEKGPDEGISSVREMVRICWSGRAMGYLVDGADRGRESAVHAEDAVVHELEWRALSAPTAATPR